MFEVFFIRDKENKLYTKYLITVVILLIAGVLYKLISGIATAETQTITRPEYLMTQFRVLVTYIRLLFIPYNQNMDYEFAISHTLFDIPTLGSLLILIGIVIGGVFLFKKYRLLSFGIFWFFLTQSIESSIFPITDIIFEHRLYLSMFGFVLFFVSLFYYFVIQKKSHRFVVSVLLLIIAAYSYAAYTRNKIWETNFSLFSDVIAKSPHKARPYYGRAKIYNDLKQYPEAITDCNKALENDPRCAEAYNNRGMALALLNRNNFPKAFADFDSALSIQPLYPDAMQNLANMLFMVGNYDSAIVKFYNFIQAFPNAVGGYNGLGASYMNKNMLDSAIVNFDKGIKLTTENAQLYFNRGLAYLKKNQFNSAMLDFNNSLTIDPNNGEVYYNRALAYRSLAMPTQAWQDIQTAIAKGYKIPQWIVDQLKRELSNQKKANINKFPI
jgi:tetratricopeptide (TPR) repeat protein